SFFALSFRGLRRVAEHLIYRGGHFWNAAGRIGEDGKRARFSFGERDCLFDIGLIEVNRIRRFGPSVDSANRELEIYGIDGAFEHNTITELPAVFLGELVVDDGAGAIALPSQYLL